MTLADLLANAAMLSATLDETHLHPLRARLFERLRASGWAPLGRTRSVPPDPELAPATGRVPGSDAALLAAFVSGQASAFDVLFDRHAARLNGYARRWLGGANAADAVQEAFIVLFEKAEVLLAREDVNVGGYLFLTLRYKVLRGLAARETPEADAGADEISPDDDGLTAVLRSEDSTRLASLLERTCNPLEQHVIMLDLEDRDDAEIATELALTRGHVRVVRHRALGKLRSAEQQAAS